MTSGRGATAMQANEGTTTRTRRRGRLRAVLAGGSVLGLGAAMTMAAWTDQAHVATDITTGVAQFQANVSSPYRDGDGAANWKDHHGGTDPDGVGQLAFTVPVGGLTPSDVVFAPVALRTVEGSTGFSVVVPGGRQEGGEEELVAGLRYRVRQMAGPGCSTATPATFESQGVADVVGAADDWQELDVGSGGGATLTLPAAPDASSPGSPVHLCFALRIDPERLDVADPDDLAFLGSLQGLSAEVAWLFEGTST